MYTLILLLITSVLTWPGSHTAVLQSNLLIFNVRTDLLWSPGYCYCFQMFWGRHGECLQWEGGGGTEEHGWREARPADHHPPRQPVQLRGLLLRGERLQDLPESGRQWGRGARQGLGRLREQQEESRPALETEGGQRRGETRYLGLSRHTHLQTRHWQVAVILSQLQLCTLSLFCPQDSGLRPRLRVAIPNVFPQVCHRDLQDGRHPQHRVPQAVQGRPSTDLSTDILLGQKTHEKRKASHLSGCH